MKLRFYFLVSVIHTIPEVMLDGLCLHNLPGVHQVFRIKPFFDVLKDLIDPGAKKSLVKCASYQTVSVFSAPGTSIFYDKVKCFIGNFF